MPSSVRVVEAKPFDDIFKDLASVLSSLDEHGFQLPAAYIATAMDALEREIERAAAEHKIG